MAATDETFFQRNKGWILPIVILLFAVILFAVLKATKPTAPSRPVQEKQWNVKTVPARFESRQPRLTLYGKVESPRSSTLSSSVTAYVAEQAIAEGNRVSAGQLLIQLDNRDAQLLLTQRQADVDRINAQIEAEKVRYQSDLKALRIERELVSITQRTLERFKNLSSRQAASQNQLDEARRTKQQQALSLNSREQSIADHPNRMAQLTAQQQQASALRDSAALDLERTSIRAPYAGRIASISVAPGDRVRSGDTLLSIYNDRNLEIRAQIPSRFLPRIRSQLAASASIIARAELDGQTLDLQLDRLAGEVGSGRVGVDALLRVVSSGFSLEPGRAIALDVALPAIDRVLALPPQAIYGTDRLYSVTRGRLESHRIIKVGDTIDSQGKPIILVRSDSLQSDDQILATQLPNAISGLLVKVVGAGPLPESEPRVESAPTTAPSAEPDQQAKNAAE
ncbi:HlyD family efflux transporter periplasmic adaptor subunit [Amphritea sp. HPY]|uniref:HlyD family efflux transporter periplasmic adaptor subunit n=1 Tax=Amphritea sp. HPY TaxID=3421652 RepID=UPI003D7E16E9